MTLRLLFIALVVAAPHLSAQGAERVRTGAFVEQYRFGQGHVVDRITEITFPVTLDITLGRRANLVLSTGYASVDLQSADPMQLTNQRLTGPLDTEMRFSLDLVPGRLVAFATGTLPTGQQTVFEDELPVLVTITNDVIGFAMPGLGTGGSFGAGFSVAIPLGRFAAGLATTATYPFAYSPVAREAATLRPGGEARVRLGVEGPIASRTYLRLAGSVAARSKDQVAGGTSHGVGHRSIVYASLEQGVGRAALSIYGFDVFRGSPQLEPSAVGAAILPRGNLLAAGASLAVSVGRATTFVPRAEYRVATAALSLENPALVRQGTSVRSGADIRHALSRGIALLVQADALVGDVLQGGTSYDLRGFRAALQLELVP